MSGDTGQHPGVADAVSRVHQLQASGASSQSSLAAAFRDSCSACLSSSFSQDTGLRLQEATDKLSKVSAVATDPELKAKIDRLVVFLERMDTVQLRDWQSIQSCLQHLFQPGYGVAQGADMGVLPSISLAAQMQPPKKVGGVDAPNQGQEASAFADSRQKGRSMADLLLRRIVSFFR